ncbi:hypothetical protein CFP56_005576 [Quercus suber]|uniref:Uncharacterized protein n=1 Tax=Quercus suber TaxID=58331 RepID=A0AAW0L9F5_QUESU
MAAMYRSCVAERIIRNASIVLCNNRARTVRDQAIAAAEAADGKLSAVHKRIWLIPDITAATPTTPAIIAYVTKNPVAAFPIGKYMGEKCAGRSNPGKDKGIETLGSRWSQLVDGIATWPKGHRSPFMNVKMLKLLLILL